MSGGPEYSGTIPRLLAAAASRDPDGVWLRHDRGSLSFAGAAASVAGVARALRAAGISTPALILSALGSVDDRVKGLRAGSDDYLVKPFAFSELLARLEALLRRGGTAAATTKLRVADLELDLLTRTVRRRDKPIEVLPREFRLLEYLMRNAGKVVSKTMILSHVWEYNFDPQTNIVDVLVSRLREKIDRRFEKKLLHTVRGVGYVIRA